MLLPIKPICERTKVRKDGTSVIFLQYCQSAANKTLLNTEVAIPPQCWHKKLNRVKDDLPAIYGNADILNKEIQRQTRLAEDIIGYALDNDFDDPVKFVKAVFKPDFDITELKTKTSSLAKEVVTPKKNLDFFFQFDDYIKSKENEVAPATLSVYKNLKLILEHFEKFRKKKITFNSIDLNFYEEFKNYLTYEHIHQNKKEQVKGFKTNTVGKNIKQLIIFLNNRKAKKIIPDIDLNGFKIPEEEADAIYLTPEEINTILNLDLTEKAYLIPYRDLFVFGCLTGLRFSDFSNIQTEDVRGEMLYKKQAKTKGKVVIPLRDEANFIFHKRFNKCIPHFSNGEFNTYIKEIGEEAGLLQSIKHSYQKGNKTVNDIRPKAQWITSHTCRRSFCTNEFLAGTPVELIMKISGHKSLKDFYRYIKIAPEQAGLQIKALWEKRGELKG